VRVWCGVLVVLGIWVEGVCFLGGVIGRVVFEFGVIGMLNSLLIALG
jgi:hypothetical protein